MKNIYKKFIISYYIFLILFILFSTYYVYNALVLYERSQPEKYVWSVLKDIKGNPVKFAGVKQEYKTSYKNLLKESKITIKDEDDYFVVLANEKEIFNIYLKEGMQKTKLGLLSYSEQKIKKIEVLSDKNPYSYKIIIPENFTLKIDGKEIKKSSEETTIEEFEEITHSLYPKALVYNIDKLSKDPKIEVSNNYGKKVKLNQESDEFSSYEFYKTDDYAKEITEDFDVLDFAKKWSLFLTNDLNGGFTSLKPFLIEDSKTWKYAYDWMKSVDRTFVSTHTLRNPIFTNDSVKDCYIYSDKAFSCLVKLEKNMTVSGKLKVEKIDDRMYFLFDEGWKFVDIQYAGE